MKCCRPRFPATCSRTGRTIVLNQGDPTPNIPALARRQAHARRHAALRRDAGTVRRQRLPADAIPTATRSPPSPTPTDTTSSPCSVRACIRSWRSSPANTCPASTPPAARAGWSSTAIPCPTPSILSTLAVDPVGQRDRADSDQARATWRWSTISAKCWSRAADSRRTVRRRLSPPRRPDSLLPPPAPLPVRRHTSRWDVPYYLDAARRSCSRSSAAAAGRADTPGTSA